MKKTYLLLHTWHPHSRKSGMHGLGIPLSIKLCTQRHKAEEERARIREGKGKSGYNERFDRIRIFKLTIYGAKKLKQEITGGDNPSPERGNK